MSKKKIICRNTTIRRKKRNVLILIYKIFTSIISTEYCYNKPNFKEWDKYLNYINRLLPIDRKFYFNIEIPNKYDAEV